MTSLHFASTLNVIFPDPPYDKKALHLYASLAQFADRVLVDGGSLIAYAGTMFLPEVMDQLRTARLRYWWTVVVSRGYSGPRKLDHPLSY
jgi:16S rRNA G966 N2-methylase RsmD